MTEKTFAAKILRVLVIGLIIWNFSLLISPPARAENENVMLILDASGSMWGRVDEKPKIVVARKVINTMLKDIGPKVNMGVIAYGHRSKGNCRDIQTIIPVGPVNVSAYMSVINKISPKGKTPISDAVLKGAEELRFREEKATIVLVSDGLETCGANLCELSKTLATQGIDFKVHVVGFDLKDEDTRSLQCLAKETGGKYLAADNAAELSSAIGQVVAEVKQPEPKPAPPPIKTAVLQPSSLNVKVYYSANKQLVDRALVSVYESQQGSEEKGKKIRSFSASRPLKIPPGNYYIETKVGKIIIGKPVAVLANKNTEAELILNAGLLSVEVAATPGGKPLDRAYIYVYEPQQATSGQSKAIAYGNQRKKFTLPAGKYFVTGQLGKAKVGQEVEITAGELIKANIVLNAGVVKITAVAEQGGKPLDKAYVYVYEPTASASGQRATVTSGNQRTKFTIPAGRYFVTAQLGKTKVGQEIDVKAGEFTETTIVLSAAALKITATAAEGGKPLNQAHIYIYENQQQLDGKRKLITSGNQRTKFTIPAGKYFVVAALGKTKIGKEIEVSAGRLTEDTIVLGVGALKVNVIPAEGAKSLSKAFVYIYSPDKQLDGSRKQITAGSQKTTFKIPGGKYYVVAAYGRVKVGQEIEVKAGKLTETTINVNAGALNIISEKPVFFTVYSAEKNLDGSRDRIIAARSKQSLPLAAGKYVISAKDQGKTAEAEVEIKAGKLSEVTLTFE